MGSKLIEYLTDLDKARKQIEKKSMWSSELIEWIDIELTSFCNIDCPMLLSSQKKKRQMIFQIKII